MSDVPIAAQSKILLVDDEAANRILVANILRQPDYVFIEASGGIQALDLLQESYFDLVITDLRMPDLDGIALAGRARARWPDIPIVLMSGYFSQAAWKLTCDGFAGFIQKPINRTILIRLIQRILIKRKFSSDSLVHRIRAGG